MCIKVWKEYYFRYNPAIVAQDHVVKLILFLSASNFVYLTLIRFRKGFVISNLTTSYFHLMNLLVCLEENLGLSNNFFDYLLLIG